MVKEGQKTQWSKKDRQHNGQRKKEKGTNNDLQNSVFCPSLTIVLSVLLWPLCCLSFFDHCVVCPSLTIVLSVLLWPLCCLSLTINYTCVGCVDIASTSTSFLLDFRIVPSE
jgi:hypothetical protein